jgi:hypothetical protein
MTAVVLAFAHVGAFAADLTGEEKVVASVIVRVAKTMDGKLVGYPTVNMESMTLRDCYNLLRFGMNDTFTEATAGRLNGELRYASISATCVYEESGGWKDYFVGYWTADGRYEPKLLFPSMRIPEWKK